MLLRATGKYLPVRWMFFFQEALTETIGLEGTNAVLRAIPSPIRCPEGSAKDLEKSVDFSCYSAICASVTEFYGESGARWILTSAGRTAFTRLLKMTAAMVGAEHSGFSLESAAPPFEVRMQSIVRLLGLVSDVECKCEIAGDEVRFRIISCPECAGRPAAGYLCHSMGGMVQAAADWFGAGPAVKTSEIRCMAQGDSQCEFSIAGVL
ncbi:MAG: 4-vinyl reductase [Anaerolineales bacterium]